MSEPISFAICLIFGSVMLIAGGFSLESWCNKIDSWETAPSFCEIVDSLLDGLLGIVGATVGGIIVLSAICLSIFLS